MECRMGVLSETLAQDECLSTPMYAWITWERYAGRITLPDHQTQ